VQDIVVNLAWQGAMLRSALGDGSRFDVQLHYTDEGTDALETGGGIFNALPLLGEGPFIVVSGDIWTDFPMRTLLTRLAAPDVAHFVMAPNPDFHPRGDFMLSEGRVREGGGQRYTYANIAILTREFFAQCQPGKFPLVPVMRRWIREERVSGELYTGEWRNVGTPAQLNELNDYLTAS
jgi:MurNAc alpha-1-phosphate uridylyltransferase